MSLKRYFATLPGSVAEPGEVSCAGLDAGQAAAVRLATARSPGVCLVTGSAGSGKTEVIRSIARTLEAQGRRLVVLAVAHRAVHVARRRVEASGTSKTQFATIAKAERDGAVTRWADVVLIDEASMVGARQLRALLARLGRRARMVLVGDPGQLPPIEDGFPFRWAIAAGVPRAHLVGQYRQRGGSGILRVASCIREGRPWPRPLPDGVTVHAAGRYPVGALAGVLRGASTATAVPMIIAWRRDDVLAANRIVQRTVTAGLPAALRVTMEGSAGRQAEVPLRLGDRIVVRENLPGKRIFNGMVGRLSRADGSRVAVDVDERRVWLPVTKAQQVLELGYALTCHRAQGGEWPEVVVCLPAARSQRMRRWFYTAVTRAQRKLHIIGCGKVA